MGARVALQAALAAPQRVRSLALIGAAPGIADPTARAQRVAADEQQAKRLESEPFEMWVDDWMSQPLFASQARLPTIVRAEARAQRLRNRPAALAGVLRGMGTGSMPPLTEALSGLAVPSLLVAGELDTKFTALARDMAARMTLAQVAIVPRAGHAVQLDAPQVLAGVVASWLAEL
jgi:2-succinyl-6-hydroxy-2,4-cyclohexadiene-1-carboxylate synthase